MMQWGELLRFLKRRSQIDTPVAFASRLTRFGLLSVPILLSELDMQPFRRNGTKYVVRNVWGNDMLLNPKDRGIGSDLLLYHVREPLVCTKFRECLKEGMVVYDIGANIGYYALQEATLVGEGGKVYAIEPVPDNRKMLEMNMLLNGYTNMEIYECAIGDSVRADEIRQSAMSNLSTMVDKSGYRQYVKSIPVWVETVDHFMRNKRLPDVIRMDTEGYEVNIVAGMQALLKSGRPLILFIETHFDMLRESVFPMLKMLKFYGFHIKVATHETHPVVQKSWLKPLVNLCERGMGATGYVSVTIDDLMYDPRYTNGQVENMELIFERT